ncbi:MAG: short-chain dehydrogenase/reductase [Comamonadaceae bacterium]|nr:short-chain dehydrogenase/reductase [Comamonadaceae bacterium]
MELGLRNKCVLITGASRGIGMATAQCMADEGCRLRLVARDPQTLATTVDRIGRETGAEVVGNTPQEFANIMRADLRIWTQVIKGVGAEVDVLVNNAGDMAHGSLDQIDAQAWRTAWDLKVYATIDLTRLLYARMKQRGRGVIINVIGISGGEMIVPGYIAGTAGNAALDAFTRALGTAAPADGLRVVGVHPGLVATDRQINRWRQWAQEQLGDAQRWSELTAHLPFGRMAHAREIGQAIVFLASEAASYISGTSLTVDGGFSQRHQAR